MRLLKDDAALNALVKEQKLVKRDLNQALGLAESRRTDKQPAAHARKTLSSRGGGAPNIRASPSWAGSARCFAHRTTSSMLLAPGPTSRIAGSTALARSLMCTSREWLPLVPMMGISAALLSQASRKPASAPMPFSRPRSTADEGAREKAAFKGFAIHDVACTVEFSVFRLGVFKETCVWDTWDILNVGIWWKEMKFSGAW